jgi:hypothetical protein
VTEQDLTHLDETLTLHDSKLDPRAGSRQQFHQRCLKNTSHRAMHHHVFSPKVLVEMFSLLQVEILSLGTERPHHIIVQARKPLPVATAATERDNASYPVGQHSELSVEAC